MPLRILFILAGLGALTAFPLIAHASDPSIDDVLGILGARPDPSHSVAVEFSRGVQCDGIGCFNVWDQFCRAEPPPAPSACLVESCLNLIPRVAQWEVDCSSTPAGVSPPFGMGIRIRRHASGTTERLLLALRAILDTQSREAATCQRGTSPRCVMLQESSFDQYSTTVLNLSSSRMVALISPAFVQALRTELPRAQSQAAMAERECDAKVLELRVTDVVFAADPACGERVLPGSAVSRLRAAYGHAYRRRVETEQLATFSATVDQATTAALPDNWASTFELTTAYTRFANNAAGLAIREATDEHRALLVRIAQLRERISAHAAVMARAECDAQLTNIRSLVIAAQSADELNRVNAAMASLNRRILPELGPALTAADRSGLISRMQAIDEDITAAGRRIADVERATAAAAALAASANAAESIRAWCQAHGLTAARQREISRDVARVMADRSRIMQIASQMPLHCLQGFPGVELQCAIISFRQVRFDDSEAEPYLTCLEGRTLR